MLPCYGHCALSACEIHLNFTNAGPVLPWVRGVGKVGCVCNCLKGVWVGVGLCSQGCGCIGKAPRAQKAHHKQHRLQQPSESPDQTQHGKGRTGGYPGPRKRSCKLTECYTGGGSGKGPRTTPTPRKPSSRHPITVLGWASENAVQGPQGLEDRMPGVAGITVRNGKMPSTPPHDDGSGWCLHSSSGSCTKSDCR